MNEIAPHEWRAILSIALDLTASLTSGHRGVRLLRALRQAVVCDGAALFLLEGGVLIPQAAHGLAPEVMGRTYPLAEHPRLAAVCESPEPIRFPPDSPLPDPFDGMLAADRGALGRVHACLGCPLRVEGELVGVLTADALAPGAFDALSPGFLAALGALAGAALRTGQLIEALERGASRLGLVARTLIEEARGPGSGILGASPGIVRLRHEIELVAASDLTVLVTGETGTGKELVARAVHAASRRSGEPLLTVNCAALSEALAESELFGHRRGAFTGAVADRPGKFEVADGGTLLLDEVGELSLPIQAKLLRALQNGEIQRVGADRPLRVDVRVIAATNRDLARAAAAGRFRADLYHRLAQYPLVVPPLRERGGDIPLLAGHLLSAASKRMGLPAVRLSAEARDALAAWPWPGNVRELENVLSRAALRRAAAAPAGAPVVLSAADLGPEFAAPAPQPRKICSEQFFRAPGATPAGTLREQVEEAKRAAIRRALAAAGGNQAAAARALGVHRGNLNRTARRLGLL